MSYSTIHKKELLEFFKHNIENVFSADDVCASLPNIPKSTLYRLLSKLVEEGEVEKIANGERRVCYRYSDPLSCPHHLHLHCSKCGRLEHLSEEESERLIDIFQRETDFKVNVSSTVEGICKRCQK